MVVAMPHFTPLSVVDQFTDHLRAAIVREEIRGTMLFERTSFERLEARQYLAQRGILAPHDVSLICGDPDPTFDWYHPSVAHISWDTRVLIRRIVNWGNNIARAWVIRDWQASPCARCSTR